MTCFERFLAFINKTAYMDVAIQSTSFCTAAKNAFLMITSEISTIAVLNGACFVFQWLGCALIAISGAFLTFTIVTTQGRGSQFFRECGCLCPLHLIQNIQLFFTRGRDHDHNVRRSCRERKLYNY